MNTVVLIGHSNLRVWQVRLALISLAQIVVTILCFVSIGPAPSSSGYEERKLTAGILMIAWVVVSILARFVMLSSAGRDRRPLTRFFSRMSFYLGLALAITLLITWMMSPPFPSSVGESQMGFAAAIDLAIVSLWFLVTLWVDWCNFRHFAPREMGIIIIL